MTHVSLKPLLIFTTILLAMPLATAADPAATDDADAACTLGVVGSVYLYSGPNPHLGGFGRDGCRYVGLGFYSGECLPYPDHIWCRYDGFFVRSPA